MKKLYTTLALAAAVAFGASAAAPAQKALQLGEASALSSTEIMETTPSMSFQKIGGQKAAPTNMDELCGIYGGSIAGLLESMNDEAGFTLSPGEGANDIVMTGLYSNFPVYGTVDFAAKTISFPKQEVFLNTYYNKMVYICVDEWDDAAGSYVTSNSPIVFDFSDGHIKGYSEGIKCADGKNRYKAIVAYRLSDGYFFAAANFDMELFVPDAFDLTGWTKVGTAKFQDNGWIMNGMFGTEGAASIPFQNVEYYTKEELCEVDEEMHTYLALYQPYAWFDSFINSLEDAAEWVAAGYVNESTINGGIVIDITWPHAVLVPQGIYCGFKNDGDYYFPYNQEYKEFYENGFDGDDIAEGLSPDVSTFDEATKVIEITNCYFGINANTTAMYQWVNKDQEPLPTLVLVQLDENFSSINTIVTDDNAPVEYYNLQGQRVSENAKGLVIRKQGNNVVKVVR